ncbi:MAG: hypothetical protein O6840_00145 [Nitrospirae bacterium]|nr:hypothetical protein [Nitrospirota bacterium]
MESRSRTSVSPLVRQAIEEEALRDPSATSAELIREVRKRLDRRNIETTLPKERAVQKIAKKARESVVANSPDELWSPLISGKETPSEAFADLLVLNMVSKMKDARFTVRRARWGSSLRSVFRNSCVGAIKWSEAEELLRWAELYAGREYAGEVTGIPVNTLDLDAELAYRPWIAPLNRWLYEQAVRSGAVPPSGRNDGWDTSDFFYDEAIKLLEEAEEGSDIREADWYPEARAVVIFWLREISSKIPRWNAADWDDLSGDDKVSWEEMGQRLTKEVVAKARQLDQHIPTPSEPDTGGGVVWEPSETLEEVGLL